MATVIAALLLIKGSGRPLSAPAGPSGAIQSGVKEAYGRLPLSFEANQGQTYSQVKFLARNRGYNLFLTPTEAVLTLSRPVGPTTPQRKGAAQAIAWPEDAQATTAYTVLRMQLLGANPAPRVTGLDKLPGQVNYFTGNDTRKWVTNIPTFARVQYQDVYPGVNLVYYGDQRQLEYDFVVTPGADPDAIELAFQGTDQLEIDAGGNLVLQIDDGRVILHAPTIYQRIDGVKQAIPGGYVLQGEHRVGFRVGSYDAGRYLFIDPVLNYSTYLGGGEDDEGRAIAVDAAGNAYVTGWSRSTDFPTANPLQPANGGSFDAFVVKLNPTGSALLYATYLGGSSTDVGRAIAVDASGNAHLTGETRSTDFPTVKPLQPANASGSFRDAFVAKLNATGSALIFSTYLGGSSTDVGWGIAVDGSGNAFVAGWTNSTDFPTAGPLQPAFGGGDFDAFVAKLNLADPVLVYSTYLGGGSDDFGNHIVVDTSGNAYVTGGTNSTDFPTANPLQPASGGSSDAFVTKLNPTGSAFVYSTYLGGSSSDESRAIAVDASGDAYLTGGTDSTDFPTANPLQPANASGGFRDAFVAKLNATGSALVFSTYLGGSGVDEGRGIAVGNAGGVYVTGETDSTDFPIADPLQPNLSSSFRDAFVAKLNPVGSALVFSTYLGGRDDETGFGIAVDASGDAYVTGKTGSTDFPAANPLQPASGGFFDAFIAKVAGIRTPTPVPTATPTPTLTPAATVTPTLTPTATVTPTPPPPDHRHYLPLILLRP